MSTRVYNAVENKADLYARIPSDGEFELLLCETSLGDIPLSLWQYDANSSATDNFAAGVIKPTLQTGNGRWLRRSYYANLDSLVPTGSILMWGATSAPTSWLLCDGSAISRSTYASLFSVIGTNYGLGDGSTTFNLPDMRQRFPLGKSSSGTGSNLAETGGSIDHTHTISHTHQIDPPSTTSGGPSGTVSNLSLLGVGSAASDSHTHDVNIPAFTSGGVSNSNSGSSNPPYLVMNFIIKT